jgi:hypothetical protein
MKRKEANLKQWKELYELALEVKALKPWEYLWDMDIITILLPEYKEPFYCSIMGRNGEFTGIGIYHGFKAMNEFFTIIKNDGIPSDQLIRYQNCIMCNYGNREELTKKEWQLTKDLGYKFRGKNNWIYFHSFKSGYAPFMLEQEEVLKAIEVFKGLIMALRSYIFKGIKVDFENGEVLLRHYDEERELWFNRPAPMFLPPMEYPIPIIQDELLISKLKKQENNGKVIEIDIAYLNALIDDKDYQRPIIPRTNIIADKGLGIVIDFDTIGPDEDDTQVILGTVINYIMNNGRPKTIFARDGYIKSILEDLCSRTDINLKTKGRLTTIDKFMRELSETM